jgi:hypothetical protein
MLSGGGARGGMLYFLYNPRIVAVLVCHDVPRGEFVLQVPYFKEAGGIEGYIRDRDRCLKMVRDAIFSPSFGDPGKVKIEIKNVNGW